MAKVIKSMKQQYLDMLSTLTQEVTKLRSDISDSKDEKLKHIQSLKQEQSQLSFHLKQMISESQASFESIMATPRSLPPHQSDLLNTIPSLLEMIKSDGS